MSRDYFIHDALGRRRVGEMALPLRIGGARQAGIVIPDAPDDDLYAFIALHEGHAYVQPAGESGDIYLNDERLTASAWLKSGDRINIGDALLTWQVQGDKVVIDVMRESDRHRPQPPRQPPPAAVSADPLPVPVEDAPAGRDGHAWRNAAIVAAVVLLLAAAWLLLSTSIMVDIDPPDATVELRGFPPPITLGDTRLVMPGNYALKASRPGYADIEEALEVPFGPARTFRYTLRELPGLLTVETVPPVACRLFIDDAETPLDGQGRAEVARGAHRLRIETERYFVHEQDIEVDGFGKPQTLTIELQPAWAAVSITSRPQGAEVSVDGLSVGRTPLTTDILQGGREIRLVLDGFKPFLLRQEIRAGQAIDLAAIELEPVDGRLSLVTSPAGATVTIDGVYRGVTPLELDLAANTEHAVRIGKAGYRTVEQALSLKPGETRTVETSLPAEYGTVFLSVKPAGARLSIDGVGHEHGSGRLRLTTQPHRLTVSKPGYESQTVTVTPSVGVSERVDIVLQKEGAPAGSQADATMPPVIKAAGGIELRLVRPDPDATLKMGASRREAGRRSNESRRLVRLQRPFYFGITEVSNAQFRRFRPEHDSGSLDGASLDGDQQPVVNVGWDDAARYCNWLSEQQGLPAAYVEENGRMRAVTPMTTGYRLPTEAEWAWVARRLGRDSEQRYPWNGVWPPVGRRGNFADARIADTLADVVPGGYDDGYRGTAPTASFPPWPKGFYDLGGNVAEWIHDYYAVYPGEAQRLVTDPAGPASGSHHVVRGSGWRHGNITELRLSYRDYSGKPRYDLGFRVARYAK